MLETYFYYVNSLKFRTHDGDHINLKEACSYDRFRSINYVSNKNVYMWVPLYYDHFVILVVLGVFMSIRSITLDLNNFRPFDLY